jgi:chemotaxis protein methyltransferase CheR
MIKNPLRDDYNQDTLNIEIKLLLEAIYLSYGYDFRNYSKAHIKRRILHRLSMSGLRSVSEMQYKVLHDKDFLQILLGDFSINVTEMFRDPEFYQALRHDVVPLLKTYPRIKVWHAGCATGEEVYSMAILLKEEGLYDRTQFYATDFNRQVLKTARRGEYSIDNIREYIKNYQRSGGKGSLSDFYDVGHETVKFHDSLKKNIVFAEHNLVTDSAFAEMNLIVCRNVLIYFDRELQRKVIGLFYQSLIHGGLIAIGNKETLEYSGYRHLFDNVNYEQRIYFKKYV